MRGNHLVVLLLMRLVRKRQWKILLDCAALFIKKSCKSKDIIAVVLHTKDGRYVLLDWIGMKEECIG